MPVSSAIQQKNFKLTIDDGLPQATVENIGGIHWLKCCPLCGCTHEILGVNEGLPYTPLCQRLPLMFKTQQVIWHKLYPDVTKYTTLHLILGKSH